MQFAQTPSRKKTTPWVHAVINAVHLDPMNVTPLLHSVCCCEAESFDKARACQWHQESRKNRGRSVAVGRLLHSNTGGSYLLPEIDARAV
jgi:hypothetical protein